MQPSSAATACAIGRDSVSALCEIRSRRLEELLLNALFKHGHGSYDSDLRARFLFSASAGVKGRLQPLQAFAVDRNHIEAARRHHLQGRAGSAALRTRGSRRFDALTLAAAPPCLVSARARTSTKTSVPSRSRRSDRSRRRARWGRARPDNCAPPATSRPLQMRPARGLQRFGPMPDVPPGVLCSRVTAGEQSHRCVEHVLARDHRRGRGRCGRRAAVSGERAVRRGHADRQPGRPDAARGACACAWWMPWPAKTRGKSAACCSHLGLHKPLIALHEHNEREAARAVIERLARGERVAYVSDAGTPAVSRPGCGAGGRGAGRRLSLRAGARCQQRRGRAVGGRRCPGGGFRFRRLRADTRRPSAALACSAWPHAARRRRAVRGAAPHRRAGAALGRGHAQAPRHAGARADQAVRERGDASTPAGCLHGSPPMPTVRAASSWSCSHAMAAEEPAALDAAAERTLTLLLAELPLKQAVALASSHHRRAAQRAVRAGAGAAWRRR